MVRIVTINPPKDFDEIEEIVKFGKNLDYLGQNVLHHLKVSFSTPIAWEIRFDIVVDDKTTEWWLYTTDSLESYDPFSPFRAKDENPYRLQLIQWLEDVAVGNPAALGMDMEGSYAALVVSGEVSSPIVGLSGLSDHNRVEFVVNIDRFALVRDIYTALIAYWESDALNSTWSEWSSKPKWSLRSAVVEGYLAAADGRR